MIGKDNCPFCKPARIIAHGGFSYVRLGDYPVVEGHCLAIPTRHVSNIFELHPDELTDLFTTIKRVKEITERDNPDILGWNIGVNINEEAGQTVEHCHIQIIPRRMGDVNNPRGGIRNVIPGKGNYEVKKDGI